MVTGGSVSEFPRHGVRLAGRSVTGWGVPRPLSPFPFCTSILGGLGNCDTYAAPDFPRRPGYHGFALRLFDPETGLWRIWWALTARGQLDVPVVGRFRDGEGRFECDDVLGGRPAKVRFDWKDITPSAARWEQTFSFDDGHSFEANWVMELTRILDASR